MLIKSITGAFTLSGKDMGLYTRYIVCYDVENDKTRSKFFDFLKDLGLEPIQKSVFYGQLTRAEIRCLKNKAHELLNKDSDCCLWLVCPLNPEDFKDFVGYQSLSITEAEGYETI